MPTYFCFAMNGLTKLVFLSGKTQVKFSLKCDLELMSRVSDTLHTTVTFDSIDPMTRRPQFCWTTHDNKELVHSHNLWQRHNPTVFPHTPVLSMH